MSDQESENSTPWLTNEFFEKVLQNDEEYKGKQFKIEALQSELATKNGDNYSSHMYRVKIQISRDATCEKYYKSYIIKCMFSLESDNGKMLKELGVFEKELKMYSETLVQIEETLQSVNLDLNVAPKFLHAVTEPYELLVIEDLKPLGYQMLDRTKGMDIKHCEMVFIKLAKMHAASIYLNRKDPKFRSSYNIGSFHENTPDALRTYFKNGITQGTDAMRQIPECQKYVKFFESFNDRLIDSGIELQRAVPEDRFGFDVLNHGDLWLNNMMFKYNDAGEPVDVKFVDYQMTNFGCAGVDVNYFLFTSPTDETRIKYRELWLLYHATLVKTLIKLKYDGPMPIFDDVCKEFLRGKDIGLMTICIVLPLVKLDKENSSNMTVDGIMDDASSESRNTLYTNEMYKEALKTALIHLETMGFIDNIDH